MPAVMNLVDHGGGLWTVTYDLGDRAHCSISIPKVIIPFFNHEWN